MQLLEQDVEMEEAFVPEPEEEQTPSGRALRSASITTFICFAIGFGALLTLIWTFTDPDAFIAAIANEGGSIGTGLPNNAVFRVRGLWGIRAVAAFLVALMSVMVPGGINNIIEMTERKALARTIIAGFILAAGIFAFQLPWNQPSVPQPTMTFQEAVTTSLEETIRQSPRIPAPTPGAAEALVGTWASDDRAASDAIPFIEFSADGTAVLLTWNRQFSWHEDGTFSDAPTLETSAGETTPLRWVVRDDVLSMEWSALTPDGFNSVLNHHRIQDFQAMYDYEESTTTYLDD